MGKWRGAGQRAKPAAVGRMKPGDRMCSVVTIVNNTALHAGKVLRERSSNVLTTGEVVL